METFVTLAIPALLSLFTLRMLFLPIRAIYRTGIHAFGGFACLWILNSVSGFTGFYLPLNAVTVLIAGFGGVPGIGLIALLAAI